MFPSRTVVISSTTGAANISAIAFAPITDCVIASAEPARNLQNYEGITFPAGSGPWYASLTDIELASGEAALYLI